MSTGEHSQAGDRPSPQQPRAEHTTEGPHMGPFTAGDPHVSNPTAPSPSGSGRHTPQSTRAR